MKLRDLLVSASLAVVAAGFAPAAYAQSTASTSLTGFSYQLIDLDLNDGIAASLTMSPSSIWVAAAGYAPSSGTPVIVDILDQAGTANASASFGRASATSDTTGVYSSATSTNMTHSLSGDAIVSWNFVLSANTSVVFTAIGSVDARGPGAHGWASIFADGLPDGYAQDDILQNSAAETRQLSLSFSSSLDGLSGTVGTAASSGVEILAAVPEPETYAMLLAGLGLIGACVRRRQS
jgi:hypothetical protein